MHFKNTSVKTSNTEVLGELVMLNQLVKLCELCCMDNQLDHDNTFLP